MRPRGLLLALAPLFLLAVPLAAHATGIPFFGPIIPTGNLQQCAIGWSGGILVVNNIIAFLLTLVITFVAPLSIGYAGFLMVANPTSMGDIEKGKHIITNTIVGIVIALAAWLIVGALLSVFTTQGLSGWSANMFKTNQDPCIPLAASLHQASQTTASSGAQANSTGCAGNLICGNDGTCQTDPSLDNGTGAEGQPCQASNSNCAEGLTCDATDTCSAPGASIDTGTPVGGSCTSSGGGACVIQDSGPCASSNMGVFGAAADQASQICSAESANGTLLKGDMTTAGYPVSFGLFQINITANNVSGISGCPSAFSGVYTGSNHSITINNSTLYSQCEAAALDSATNIQTAYAIYTSKSDSWGPWSTHVKCGLSFLNSVPVLAQACAIITAYD